MTPRKPAVCAYPPCRNSLQGMSPRALYCCRGHKEDAKQIRNRETAVKAPTRRGKCRICGVRVEATSSTGPLPKYCTEHHPKRPCSGCGKMLRRFSVTGKCRDCAKAEKPAAPVKYWTCLCDVCGALFEAPKGSNLCPKHNTTTTEDNQP